jgi:hypothetical protein
MLTSLNQMLSRMDALVLDRRCLRAEEGVHENPSLEEDETRMVLQMPKSDLYDAYQLNLDPNTWDYRIICDDGNVPINRAFACLLFDSIKTKELGGGWDTTQREFRMLGVNEDELRGLLCLAFQKVSMTTRDMVRCVDIANAYFFWEPARLFLVQSIDNELASEVGDIEKQIGEQERTIMSNIKPKEDLPRRYTFSTKAVRWVDEGEYYGLLIDDCYIKMVVSAETVRYYPTRTAHVLAWPTRHIQEVPIPHLHALLNFDGVTAKVGYPLIDQMYEGEPLKDITEGMEPLLVGKFYVHYDLDTDRQTKAKWITKRLIVFLLGFSMKGKKAYIFRPQEQGIASVDSNKLYPITRGEGATDEATCTRANVILDADPPPASYNFGETHCTDITQLKTGEYYHWNDLMAESDSGCDCVAGSRRRIPVLYLGPALGGKAYVFARKREMIVNVEYLFLRRIPS